VKAVPNAALACLGEYSHSNNQVKCIMGLYLYATGAHRQTIIVLATLCLSGSYTNLTSKKLKKPKKRETHPSPQFNDFDPQSVKTGTLLQLSQSCRSAAQEIAATGLFATIYDNINMVAKTAEQTIGRHGRSLSLVCDPNTNTI